MGLFAGLFRGREKRTSAVLMDVSTDSVAGAYATFSSRSMPTVHYVRRIPVEPRHGELVERAMLRALRALSDTLIREGAPVLTRASGSGRASTLLVSVDAPWQRTSVRTVHIEKEGRFTFTRELVAEAVGKNRASSDRLLVDESVVGAVLNGYETRDPYGKKANRASVVVLTSLIDAQITKHITAVLREAYHAEDIRYVGGNALRFQALYSAFPHEHDALIIDATNPHASLMLVRKGVFVALADIPVASGEKPWLRNLAHELSQIARNYPLPRVVFLLAREADAASIREALDGAHLEKLWLSDNPPKIIPVLANHLAGLVRQAQTAAADAQLLLMATYYHEREAR